MIYERQCVCCGMIFDVDYPADPKLFRCHYCKPRSAYQLNHAKKVLKRVKRRSYVSEYIKKKEAIR